MVTILLSTYNGEKYLANQLDSLLLQDFKEWRCIIRDDGSNDKTLSIIKEYTSGYPDKFVLLEAGPHTGWKSSFSRLLEQKCDFGEYLMFCDQDDIWFPQKISTMLMVACEQQSPCLIFSDLALIDADGESVGDSFFKYNRVDPKALSWRTIFAHNPIPGMSILVDVRIVKKLLPIPPDFAYDWWIIAGSYFFFKVVYLPCCLAKYRLHSQNAVGSRDPLKAFVYYVKNYGEAKKLVDNSMFLFEEFYRRFSLDSDLRFSQLIKVIYDKGLIRKWHLIKYGFLPQHIVRKIGYLLFL